MQGKASTIRKDKNLVGQVVQRHEVIRMLGKGGMGEVYLARHESLGMLRTLKVIRDDIRAPALTRRFKREALALAQLQHPNIVSVIDYGQLDNGWPFLMLEFIEGDDLEKNLSRHGPLPVPAALVILTRLAQVIEFTHGQGIVHRDLKPGNILLDRNDPRHPKVIDFGLVKLLSAEMISRLTAEGQVLGSPGYMAPEQARGDEQITGAADVYALGGIAYSSLSGKSVFGPQPPLALIYAHGRETPRRLSSRISIPDPLDELLYACLDKNPGARPSAATLARELERLLADLGGPPPDLGPLFPVDGTPSSAEESTNPTISMKPDRPDSLSMGQWQTIDVNEGPSVVTGSFFGAEMPHAPRDHDPATPEVILSRSMVRAVDVASAVDVIFAPLPRGSERRVREALQRQMLAVVSELAEILAVGNQEIATLRSDLLEVEDRLGDLEMDAALIDSELAGASEDQLVELAQRRAVLAARVNQLRARRESDQRALAVFVDHRRPSAPPVSHALYAELDQMVERALSSIADASSQGAQP